MAHARFVADSILHSELKPSDVLKPVNGKRRQRLDDVFVREVLVDGALLGSLVSRSGTITYSTDHSLIGGRIEDSSRVGEVLEGTSLSDVTSVDPTASGEQTKVLRAYVPLPFARSEQAGVLTLYQDYAPIAAAAEQAFFPVAGVLELALIGLYVALFPVLRRVTQRIRKQMREIEHLALHDELTGLPNRTLFRDRVEQAILAAKRGDGEVAIMLIDLDRFKEINDTLGHQSGDVVLADLGDRLRGVLRENETFARLGGDEFGVLLPRIAHGDAPEVAERIKAILEEPFVLNDLPLQIEGSIGIALYPESAEDVDSLIQRADVALYAAKEARSGYALYDPAVDPNNPGRLAIVGELRRAIAQGELLLYFQPITSVREGNLHGAEALLRWEHPERGLVQPIDFVPLAERTGLVGPLTRYVLAAALRQSRIWSEAGIELQLAVNVTMPNLLDLRFPDDVASLLERSGVDPGRLTLEVTETAIMADPFRVQQVLARLGEMGVRLAIDDFGTGYSSLAYLRRLPVDELKIDRSFVASMTTDDGDLSIVRSAIGLGHNLGLQVVAEGVETEEACEILARLGCDFLQGYHIGVPMTVEELTVRLRGSSAAAVKEPERTKSHELRPADEVAPAHVRIAGDAGAGRGYYETATGLRVVSLPGR